MGKKQAENPSQQFLLPGLCSRSWPPEYFFCCPSCCLLTFWRSGPKLRKNTWVRDFRSAKKLSWWFAFENYQNFSWPWRYPLSIIGCWSFIKIDLRFSMSILEKWVSEKATRLLVSSIWKYVFVLHSFMSIFRKLALKNEISKYS